MTYLLQPQQITRWAAASLHQQPHEARAASKAQTKINRKKEKKTIYVTTHHDYTKKKEMKTQHTQTTLCIARIL